MASDDTTISRRGLLRMFGMGAAATAGGLLVPALIEEPVRRFWQVGRNAPVRYRGVDWASSESTTLKLVTRNLGDYIIVDEWPSLDAALSNLSDEARARIADSAYRHCSPQYSFTIGEPPKFEWMADVPEMRVWQGKLIDLRWTSPEETT